MAAWFWSRDPGELEGSKWRPTVSAGDRQSPALTVPLPEHRGARGCVAPFFSWPFAFELKTTLKAVLRAHPTPSAIRHPVVDRGAEAQSHGNSKAASHEQDRSYGYLGHPRLPLERKLRFMHGLTIASASPLGNREFA